MADKDSLIQLAPNTLAQMMVNRVKRERLRIATMLDNRADVFDQAGQPHVAIELRVQAEAVRTGEGGGLTVQRVEAHTEDQADAAEPVQDEQLPPHRDRDDFDDATALVRARSTFGRSAHTVLPE